MIPPGTTHHAMFENSQSAYVLRWSGHGSLYATTLDHDYDESNFVAEWREALIYGSAAAARQSVGDHPDAGCLCIEEVAL